MMYATFQCFKRNVDDSIAFQKPSRYSNKVLLGNWVEDQFSYVKDAMPFNTTYRVEYKEKFSPTNWAEFVWDQKIKHEVY